MRVFENLAVAESEIRRDLAKGQIIKSTRVQQQTGIELLGRERLGYQYSIMEVPESIEELVTFGIERFPTYAKYPDQIRVWLHEEILRRIYDLSPEREPNCSETIHPLLKSTLEGNFPAYTYQDRLRGAVKLLANGLRKNLDSRRAYWPIYHPDDVHRFSDPTRIPCSLGYQPMVRDLGNGEERLVLFYLERSCDFDHFWLSDVYLASLFQKAIAADLDIEPGALIHYIISLHSFDVESQEIY